MSVSFSLKLAVVALLLAKVAFADPAAVPPGSLTQVQGIADQVYERLAKENGNDPEKMMKILGEFQSNPAAFQNYLTPEQKEKVKQLEAAGKAQH